MIARVLESKGAMVQAHGAMYKAVSQSVIFYGSKSWVVTGEMLKVLTEFHHKAAQRITGVVANCRVGRELEYQLVNEAMEAAGLHPIRVYIKKQQRTISERVACHHVYALYTEAEQMPGTSRLVQWWDQYAVNEPEEYTRKRCN